MCDYFIKVVKRRDYTVVIKIREKIFNIFINKYGVWGYFEGDRQGNRVGRGRLIYYMGI